ncbi:MAG: hypothetical protein Q9162_001439 [Coniocarpon cinnabarinum]
MSTAIKSIKSVVPLLDRILIQRLKAEAKTTGGILLPESAQKELNEGRVLAVGPGAVDREGKRLPISVGVGDRVLIPTFGGQAIKVGEEDFSLFRDHDILAKVSE